MSNLLPCPFCGSDRAWPIPANRHSEDRLYPIVRCVGCHTDVPGDNDDFRVSADSAVGRWNTRATSEADELRAENERLRDALENVAIAYGMGWDLDGVMDVARAALKKGD